MDKIPVFRPFFDQKEIEAVTEVLESRWIGLGPKTNEFEESFSQYLKIDYSVGVSSCTEALQLSLMAIGINSGEVIVPSMTFSATAHAVVLSGATPVFVDCDPDTLCIDVSKIEENIGPHTRAIIPVHYGGHPCNMSKIMNIANEHKLVVIEDVAHALGASINNKKVGTFGDFGAFSFQATKSMTTGEGGMITTKTDNLYRKLKEMRWFGINKDTAARSKEDKYSWYYEIVHIGLKSNMNDIVAAIGQVQLKKLDTINKLKISLANEYNRLLKDIPQVSLPSNKEWAERVYWNYGIKCDRRDELIDYLANYGISCSVHYLPVHMQPIYKRMITSGKIKKPVLPNTEKAWEEILSLPLYPELTNEKVRYICSKIHEFYGVK